MTWESEREKLKAREREGGREKEKVREKFGNAKVLTATEKRPYGHWS